MPIRAYTDLTPRYCWKFYSSSLLGSSLVWHDVLRRTPSDVIDCFWQGAQPLTWSMLLCQHSIAPQREHTLSPPQVSIRVRQQKPNWHRRVNAHGWVFTFIFKPHTVSKPAETASGNSVHWPLCPHLGPGAGCTSTDVLALMRVLGCGSDNEETCLSYSSLGRSSCVFNMKHFTVKSNPKTSWIQSSHTLSMTLFGTE